MDYTIYLFPLLSVILGYILAIFFAPKSKNNLKLLLAFSGAFLLSLTVMHLLPEVYHSEEIVTEPGHEGHFHSKIGIYIMIGIVFQIILEYFQKAQNMGMFTDIIKFHIFLGCCFSVYVYTHF